MPDEPTVKPAERPHVRVTEESPHWQQVLQANTAFQALTRDAGLAVAFYSDHFDVPDANPAQARRIGHLAYNVLATNGYPQTRPQLSARGGGLRVRVPA